MVLRWSTFKMMSCDLDLHPRWPPSAGIVLTYIVHVRPYGKNVLKKFPRKPVSQFKANMAWMVLEWSTFKIVFGDHDLHPRWPPSAGIVLT